MTGKTMRYIGKFGVVAGLVALMGCSTTSTDPIFTQFHREAGAITDLGNFGEATMNNTLVQNGEKSATHALGGRFAAEVPTTINFAFNSAQLDAQSQAVLRQQADWIRQFPEIRFRVYGHTDAVGSNSFNKRLGKRRARAVVAYLAGQGISRKRLEALVSFGETRPVIMTPGRERQNRRTVTEVSGFVKRHPTVLDGKYAQIIYRDYISSGTPPSQLTSTTIATNDG
jgi:outer membrane protein OmpA-like peptidoglycan-associated protein